MPRLTKHVVERALPKPNGDVFLWDNSLKGFGVRVKPSGARSYLYQYRNAHGTSRRITFGQHGRITIDQARELAGRATAAIARGEDPAESRRALREASSIRDLVEDYLERHAPKKRASSRRNDQSMLDRYVLPRLGSRKVADVTRGDIERLHLTFKTTPYAGNRVLSLLGKLFVLAIAAGWRADNPCRGVVRYQEDRRERWLSDEELKRLLEALNASTNQRAAGAIKLLLLTGSRRGEVLSARWEDFDLDRGVWTKPSHHTKQQRIEHVPLSPSALQLLAALKAKTDAGDDKERSEFLFPGRVDGQSLVEIKKAWAKVLDVAGLPGLHLHDLRHTYASHLVSAGVSLHVVGRLLGHTQAATTHRYAHLSDDALRHATDRFGSKVLALVDTLVHSPGQGRLRQASED
jgi:integrase